MGAGASSTPTAPQADGAWKAGQWMATLKNSKGLSICDILGDAVCDAANQADQLSVLRSLGEEDDSTKIAERVKGELCEIVDVIFQGTKQLNSTKFATTQEYNEKYMQAPGGFTLSYGGLDNFYGGLESQVGSPSPNFIAAMHQEHCEATDSDKDFTTGNYGVTTTSRTEFAFVFGLDGGATAAKSTLFEEFQRMVHEFSETVKVEAQDEGIASQKDFVDLCEQQLKKLQQAQRDDVSWPCESTSMLKDRTKCRCTRNLLSFVEEFKAINRLLTNIKEPALLVAELLGARLYTGPMFVKYNAVLRSFTKSEFMVKQFKDLCADNLFVTTLHAINSAFIKLSKLQAAQVVYRGMSGGTLPREFREPNQFNVCGGVEFAFMSTTTDRNVALFYASNESKPGLLFEIQLGMVDRGADLRWLSQYPHEAEICFGPLSGLQVIRTRVESSVLIVEVRMNVNMVSMTLEQVVAKRYKVVAGMCDNIMLEIDKSIKGSAPVVEASVLIVEVRLNVNMVSMTLEQVVAKRYKVVAGMCDNIMLEIDKSIKGDDWTKLCRQLNDDDGKVKVVIHDIAQKQLSKIKARLAEDFNTDKLLLSEMQTALSVGSGVRLQRAAVFDQAAHALQDVALAQASRSFATTLRKDELIEQEVILKFNMQCPPCGDLWLLDVLGFVCRADGAVEVALAKDLYAGRHKSHCTALFMYDDRAQLKGQVLAAIDGDRELGRKCRELQAAWKVNAELSVVLTLGRNHTTQEAHEIFKNIALEATSGEVEIVASRLTRLLEVNPGVENLEELNLSGLSDKAGAAVAMALTRAGGARVRILKFGENDFSGQAACALGRLLASNSTFLELSLFGCQIGDEAGAELLQALARRTGAASPLCVLWLNNNDLGAGSAAAAAAALRGGTLPALEQLMLDRNAFSASDTALIRAGWMETMALRPEGGVLRFGGDGEEEEEEAASEEEEPAASEED
eukprot:CAMPEP_0203973722 /NCGR_PEP_ID=MMETSP0359-20131031/99736_1 /ASSEMBLY_ACC=CAM_ASM_000338 /TAXON_ID=268821 /ORGANISM="Scrippsiella Hangoei, Strain SHTV-5" /LENGTH=963 /DNA_ID=CAMNT_0050911887 /DNA_START=80 /DNA_END=2970 /DNA_ORIENTATION=-